MNRCLPVLFCLFWGWTAVLFGGYEVSVSSRVFEGESAVYLVKSDQVLEISEELPEHPKVDWLPAKAKKVAEGEYECRFRLVPRSTGEIQLPPIPLQIGGRRILVDLPVVTARPNPLPKDAVDLRVFYNGELKPPAQVHVGEKIDFDILALYEETQARLPSASRFAKYRSRESGGLPSLEVEGVTWHFFSGRIGAWDQRFFLFGRGLRMPIEHSSATIGGKKYQVWRFKCRCYFSEAGKQVGIFSMPLAGKGGSRYEVLRFETEVLELPEVPAGFGADSTGLVGNWEFEASFEPEQPKAGESFQVKLDIKGTGDPSQLADLDFSRPGFPGAGLRTEVKSDSSSDQWEAELVQTLIPSGEIPTYAPIRLASFDTSEEAWTEHRVSEGLPVEGAVGLDPALSPSPILGSAVLRPVFLNLRPLAFLLLGLGPVLPIMGWALRRALQTRDPARARRRKAAREIQKEIQSGRAGAELVDDRILPLLREHGGLPAGATAREVAEAFQSEEKLAAELVAHHESAFGGGEKRGVDFSKLGRALGRIGFLFLVLLTVFGSGPAKGTVKEGVEAFESGQYDQALTAFSKVSDEQPGQAVLHLNLAKTHLALGDPARARASVHTALLLEPTRAEAKELMSLVLDRLGEAPLPGSRLLGYRPDQFLVAGAVLWFLGFLVIALRRVRWLGITLLLLSLCLGGLAWHRARSAYVADQFMVIENGLPRESEPGLADPDLAGLEDGRVLQAAEVTATHIRVEGQGDSFWLPQSQLARVW